MYKNYEKSVLSLTQFFSKALFMGIGISNILIKARESTIFVIILGTVFGTFLLYFLNIFNYKKIKGLKKGLMFILIYIDKLYG